MLCQLQENEVVSFRVTFYYGGPQSDKLFSEMGPRRAAKNNRYPPLSNAVRNPHFRTRDFFAKILLPNCVLPPPIFVIFPIPVLVLKLGEDGTKAFKARQVRFIVTYIYYFALRTYRDRALRLPRFSDKVCVGACDSPAHRCCAVLLTESLRSWHFALGSRSRVKYTFQVIHVQDRHRT